MQEAAMATRLLPLLVLAALSSFFLINASDVDIDCGTKTSVYTDANGIVWTGDEDLNQNGVVRTVASANSNSVVMDSMRVFNTLKRNCYDISGTSGDKVLIRPSFYYGNYDGKSSPPTFLLTIDGNTWGTVTTSPTSIVSYEAVWVLKRDMVSICLVQTNPGQFPFISALQVRELDSDVYGKVSDSFTLFTALRVSYGTDKIVRYNDDQYDRIWNPARIGTGLVVKTIDDPTLFFSVDLVDKPPVAVLENAITTATVSQFIQLPTIPAALSPVYINFYFSEVTNLEGTTDRRSFRIFMNNQSISDPISPPYGRALEMTVANLNLTSDSTFTLVATANSTLPPLINAMEIFNVASGLNAQTHSDDVTGLNEIRDDFSTQLQRWGGDPCLPSPYSWEWISCSSEVTPRVTELNLNGYGLTGALPEFSTMTALQSIDLSNNSLSGGIPDFLGALPNLKELNLANNKFSGPIPSSISRNNKIKLTVTGNPSVCATGASCQTFDATPTTDGAVTTSKKKKSSVGLIVGIIVPVFIVFWAIVLVLVVMHKRRTAAMAAAGGGAAFQGNGVGQKQNGNVNNQAPPPEASPAYLLGNQFGNGLFNGIKDDNNSNQQEGDGQNNHDHNNNYNNV